MSHEDKLNIIIWFGILGLLILTVLAVKYREIHKAPQPAPKVEIEVVFQATESVKSDPCTLKDVYCPNEKLYEVSKYTKWETCPDRPCVTASGQIATRGRTVACPRHIPLGTKVSIAERIYICEDRTHYRFDGRWDIYAGDTEYDYQQALAWGVKKLPVTILE